ncbi:hypothetical protein PRZ48_001963 [Zasmidium cellare]|uniref:C2H2-type domain-containing protein n=1 Tax=Zasmidium cellare TaxID=395010 RepID=A0ABR0F4A3_ZASCE|nr:hypothetical protein PRZ48_001963 [Zasmidium cellare]
MTTNGLEADTGWGDFDDLPSDGYLDDLPLFPGLEDILHVDESCELDSIAASELLQEDACKLAEDSAQLSQRGPKRSAGNRDLHSQLCAAGNVSLPATETFAVNSEEPSTPLSRTASLSRDPRSSAHTFPSSDLVPQSHHTLSHQASDSSMHSMDSAVSVSSKRGLRITGAYRCGECTAAFDVPSDLRHHQRKHISKDDRPYACSICTDRFLYPKDLVRHMRRKHGMQRDSQQDLRGDACASSTWNETNKPGVSKQAVNEVGTTAPDATLPTSYNSDAFETNEILALKLKAARDDAGLWLAERNYFAELVSHDHQHQPPVLYFKYDEMGRTSPVQRAKGWLLGIKALLRTEKNYQAISDPERTAEALDCLINDLENLAISEGY